MARHRVPKPGFGPHIEVVPLAGARLFTVGPESPAWQSVELPADASKLTGCFVRLRPPHNAGEEVVERVRRMFAAVAARVRVELPNRPAVFTEAAPAVEVSRMSVRETVLQLVDEVHTHDREALRVFVEEVMAHERV